MKIILNSFVLTTIVFFASISQSSGQDEILLSATPESFPGANDGKIQVTIANPNIYPPPYIYRLGELNKDPLEIQSNNPVAVFTGLGYRYYCLTVVMADGCFANGCFDFDEPCSSDGCLIANFNVEYTTDGCTVQFQDWSQGDATSWAWDFGDGSSSNLQNPSHTYSASKCYNVTLKATKGPLIREISKEICIAACSNENAPAPDCQINAPSFAAAGQTINLSVSGTGIAPFEYSWTTSGFVDPMPNNISQTISALMPENANNGDQYNFSVLLTDNNNNSTSCFHTVTIGGNPPDVEISAFGSFEAFEPLVLVAFVDFFNLTGLEEYYFYLKKGAQIIEIPGSCLNTWLDGDWDCTLPLGVPDGFYLLCVQVRDDAGTYEACTNITIGTPIPQPSSPEMYLEVKAPSNPKKDTTTNHYILESGTSFDIGINGIHPGLPHPSPCGQKEYYVVLHMKNLTTGEELPTVGDPAVGVPEIMNSLEGSFYNKDTGIRLGKGLDWSYQIGQGCEIGTLSVTADVYNIPCDGTIFPPDLSPPRNSDLYPITEPIFIDLYPKKPVISGISVNNVTCNFPIKVALSSGCGISSYEWHAYDPDSNEEIQGFFVGNTNANTVYPNLNHDRYLQYQSGAVVRFRCKVIVVDVNGFTSEYSSLIMMPVPLRIDLPATIYRCPGTVSHFLETSIAAGGVNRYEYEWSLIQPAGGSLFFASNDPHDPNPLFTAPSSGSRQYKVVVKNLNEYGEVLCQVEKNITVMVSNISLDLPDIIWPICSTGGRSIGPLDPKNLGGSGYYTFLWSTANTTDLAYLSDVNTSNPIISGIPVGQTLTFTLTVTDVYGLCTTGDNIMVSGVANNHTVTLTGQDVCYGEESLLTALGAPVQSSPPFGDIFNQYHWTTDNKHHDLSNIGLYTRILPIDEIVSSHPGDYTYTVRYQNLVTGCFAEANKVVKIHPPLRHEGYIPFVRIAVAGTKMPVWQAYSANNITEGVDVFNPGCNASVTWAPHQPTDITLNSGSLSCNRIPINGMFIPTVNHPFTVMNVTNTVTSCSAIYNSQRYIIVEAKPELWVNADKSAICTGDAMCFDVVFDMHLSNYQTSLLPPVVQVKCTIDPPVGVNKDVIIELKLVNGSGLYKGRFCEDSFFKDPSQTPYSMRVAIHNASPVFFNPLEYEIDVSGAEIQFFVLDPTNNAEGNFCIIQPGSGGSFLNLDLGLSLPSNAPCPLGTIMSSGYLMKVSAGEYIEIHPDVNIEINAIDPGEGHRFFINPCIQPQGIEPRPNTNSEPNITTVNSQVEIDLFEQEDMVFEVFPNPFTGEVNIKFSIPANCESETTINLLDITGRHLRTIEKRAPTQNGVFQINFDGKYLPPGVYLYELAAGNCRKIKKAVKVGF